MTDPLTLGGDAVPNLAVDLQPDDAFGIFVLDDSELSGPDRLGWGAADPWVNVVCDVQQVQARRGATRLQGILTRAEAAAVTITVRDDSGSLDPLANGDQVHRNTPLRLRAWGFDSAGAQWSAVLFTGTVEDLDATYHRDGPATVVVTATDVIGRLAGWEAPGRPDPGIGAGDDLPARVARVAAECGIGTVAADSDSNYAATLAPTTLAQPWQAVSDAADAELGRVWVNKADQLVLRSRGSQLSGTVRGTLSDVHGQTDAGPHCCMDEPVVVYGAESLINRALGTRRAVGSGDNPVQQFAADAWSDARYGPSSVNATLELATDAQVADWAEAVIIDGSRPELRVDRVTPVPSPHDLDSAADAWPAVCATDLGDRWSFRLHPATGDQVTRTLGVLGIELDLSPDGWTVHWTTAEAPTPGAANPSGWWALDVSELDESDLLAPYGGTRGVPTG